MLCRELHNLNIEPRTGQELGAGVQAAARRFKVDNRTRANDHFGPAAGKLGNHLDGSRNRHGHFRDGNAAL